MEKKETSPHFHPTMCWRPWIIGWNSLKKLDKNRSPAPPPPPKKETVLRSPKGKVFDRTGPPAPFLFKKMNRNGQSGPLFSLNRQTARKPSKKQRRRRGRRVKRLSDQKDTNDFRRENGEPKKKTKREAVAKKKTKSQQSARDWNQSRTDSREPWELSCWKTKKNEAKAKSEKIRFFADGQWARNREKRQGKKKS